MVSGLINLDFTDDNKRKFSGLNDLLKDGLPVIVTNRERFDCHYTSCTSKLFFSDGTVNGNQLGVRKGRNVVYADLLYSGSSYGVDGELTGDYRLNCLSDNLNVVKFTGSYFNQSNYYNEGTFTGVPTEGILTRSGGSNVTPADEVKFKDALTALRFASEAIHFSLPHFYYSGTDSVLKAVEGLIGKAVNESGINSDVYTGSGLRTINNVVHDSFKHKLVGSNMPSWWGSYDLLPSDYVLCSDASYAFVKVAGMAAYVIPIKEQLGGKLSLIIELALMPDFVMKFFPEGF